MICSKCGADFQPSPNKPGRINVCLNCVESPETHAQKVAADAQLHKDRARAERENKRRAEREAKEKAAVESYGFEIVRRLKGTVPHTK